VGACIRLSPRRSAVGFGSGAALLNGRRGY
jgi:hypothetical protein